MRDEPEGVAFTPEGKFVYVTCETKGEVCVIDAETNKVVAEVAVGGRPRTVAFLPDSSRAFIPSETAGAVAVVDTRSHKVVRTLKLPDGSRPMGTALSADGKRLFVTTGRADRVRARHGCRKGAAHDQGGTATVGPRADTRRQAVVRGQRPLERRIGDRHRHAEGDRAGKGRPKPPGE